MPIVIMRYISNILLQQTECFHINIIIFIILIVIVVLILLIIIIMLIIITIVLLIIVQLQLWLQNMWLRFSFVSHDDVISYIAFVDHNYTIRKAWLKFSKTHTGSARKSFWYYNYNLHYPWMSFKPNNAWP